MASDASDNWAQFAEAPDTPAEDWSQFPEAPASPPPGTHDAGEVLLGDLPKTGLFLSQNDKGEVGPGFVPQAVKSVWDSFKKFQEHGYDPGTGDERGAALGAELATNIAQVGSVRALGGGTGLGTFGGRLSRTADLDKLSKAKTMAKDGDTPEAIWKETGWFQGADKHWRYEISDHRMAIKKSIENEFAKNGKIVRSTTLGKVISHPDLKDTGYLDYVPIRLNIKPENPIGGSFTGDSYMPGRGVLSISAPDVASAKTAILHELQHHISDYENFASGGSIGLDRTIANYMRQSDEVLARNTQTRAELTPTDRAATAPWVTQDMPFDEQVVRYLRQWGRRNEAELFGGRIGTLATELSTGDGTMRRALDLAVEMESKGHSEKDIRALTNHFINSEAPQFGGIHKGADGKWRFEIDDSKAKLNQDHFRVTTPSEREAGHVLRLGDFLDHPGLFQAYPMLADYKLHLKVDRTSTKGQGMFVADFKSIYVTAETQEQIKDVLIHEIQHGIQYIENFARGSNARSLHNVVNSDILSIFALGKPGKHFDPENIADVIRAANTVIPGFNATSLSEVKALGLALKPKEKKELAHKIADAANFEVYKRHAGEVEARNAQRRGKLDAADRRLITPNERAPESFRYATEDTPRQDQIVSFYNYAAQSTERELKAANDLYSQIMQKRDATPEQRTAAYLYRLNTAKAKDTLKNIEDVKRMGGPTESLEAFVKLYMERAEENRRLLDK